MKKIFYLSLLFILTTCAAWSSNAPQKTSLSGKVTDKATGEPIPGATIYIPDLKTGGVSGIDGTYIINDLPPRKLLINVSFVGYKLIVETIDLSTVSTKNFALEASAKEINEVVVTGSSQSGEKNRTPAPISIVPKTVLLQNSSSNIIDAIAKQPGISQVTTGAGISKPVIRGLGYNRVVVVNDGIRQEGQQWGDEHGIEIDEFSVNKVEILKGPASLSYGSDAIAGVIHFITAPTLPEGTINGNLLSSYQTNNGQIAYSADLAGNVKGFIWDVRYSNKTAHAYQNKYDGYVYNSGFTENTFGGMIGLNKPWGYSHLHFSAYDMKLGIVEGERDSTSGKFIKPVALNDSTAGNAIAEPSDFKKYDSFVPYQRIKHYKMVLNNNFIIGDGNLKLTLGFQQNRRQEFGDVLMPKQYGLYFLLNTFNYDVRYVLPERKGLDVSFGINGMQQSSQNKGTEFLVPEYSLFDIGGFTIIKKSFGKKLDLAGGLRYDTRMQHSKDLYIDSTGAKTDNTDSSAYHQFTKFNSTFSGVSGSIGATYQFSGTAYGKLNLARGYRAPNIGEVGANGEHEGTGRFEIGDPKLKPENSTQIDLSFGLNTEHVTVEIDGFYNNISNFIFLQKLNSAFGGDSLSGGTTTFRFVQGDAVLTGGELVVDIHPHPIDWLHFENSFSYVQSVQKNRPDSLKYLPMTPAPKLVSELKADIRKAGKSFRNAYVKVEAENYFKQDKFYSAYGTETATPGYTLINAGIGTEILRKEKTLFSLYISVNNLTDVAYQSHLSRLKYAPENYATGRMGVYNMGRNFSIKLMIPLNFKK
ncbi:MAG: TonB-dependent receptor [Bacteroidia bacterium]